jgi:nucleotide-binding universal stress UspA family protein
MLSILLPTDFSENAMNAIKYALQFFKYQRVEFYFMHAYKNEFYDQDDLVSRDVFDTVLARIKTESESQLKNLVQTVNGLAPNPRYTYHTISANNTLVDEANVVTENKNIDLIVMGTKGKSNERNIVFGSQTFQVLKYVKCPVLAIPENYSNTQPKHILFPTNYQIPYKRRELKLLSELAKPYRTSVEVLYISKPYKLSMRQEDNQTFIKNELKENTTTFYTEDAKKVEDGIKKCIQEKNIDLLVMVNTQHSFLEDMLFPNTLDEVSLELNIPLLALQNSSR